MFTTRLIRRELMLKFKWLLPIFALFLILHSIYLVHGLQFIESEHLELVFKNLYPPADMLKYVLVAIVVLSVVVQHHLLSVNETTRLVKATAIYKLNLKVIVVYNLLYCLTNAFLVWFVFQNRGYMDYTVLLFIIFVFFCLFLIIGAILYIFGVALGSIIITIITFVDMTLFNGAYLHSIFIFINPLLKILILLVLCVYLGFVSFWVTKIRDYLV